VHPRMSRGKLALLLVCYPVYFLLVVAGLMRLDIPKWLDSVSPNPRRVPYRLDEMFRKAEGVHTARDPSAPCLLGGGRHRHPEPGAVPPAD